MIKLAPSILAADFSRLGEEIAEVEKAGAHYLHMDIMDGRFVPNISFGIPVVQSVRKKSGMIFDVHLMIENPAKYIEAFARAGADILNVHKEAVSDAPAVLRQIKACGKRAAVTVKPGTDIEAVYEVLELADMVLIMSVEPGYGGQKLIPETLRKAEKLANHTARKGLTVEIEMDGGIDLHNVGDVINAGVNVVVAGTSVFGAADRQEAVSLFYQAFQKIGEKK